MATAKVKAYAKINLTLDVTGREGNFHTLDSFVASLDLYDLVVATSRKDKLVRVTVKGVDADKIPLVNSNAEKAAVAFTKRFSTNGADITVYRNIPAAAGLGGSSADISGTLNAMAKLYKIDDFAALKEVADSLGSDTGYMLTGGYCRIRGRGEKVERLPDVGKEKLYLLLLCPQSGVNTSECFARFDQSKETESFATQNCVERFLEKNWEGVGRCLSNGLFAAASSLNPDVLKAYEEAASFSPLGANMTGAGSAAYALFDSRELRDWAKSRYRGKFRAICAETIDPKRKEKTAWRSPFALGEEETQFE